MLAHKLYPKIKPYHSGFLNVGDGHEIYYEECGNQKGTPVLYLHGGPGAGCDEGCRRFFDPSKWRVVLFDQRGSHRSRPYASVVENTTWHLVEDIKLLLDFLGIEQTALFGGSWGSTLALVFAIKYPKRISGMVLRGIWLADNEAIKDYCQGISTTRFPETLERFRRQVPPKFRSNPVEYYYVKMMTSSTQERHHFIYEMWLYETSRCFLKQPTEAELKKMWEGDKSSAAKSILEGHYIRSQVFLENGYILKNAHHLPHVPIVMVQGRYDDVCPVNQALLLHRAIPRAKLYIVTAGHSRTDPEIQEKLIQETDVLYSKIKK